MTDIHGLEQRVEERGKDWGNVLRISIGAGLGVGLTIASGGLYSADSPAATTFEGWYDNTIGRAFYRAPLPLLGLSAVVPFTVASNEESKRHKLPAWRAIRGIGGGTLFNLAASGAKWAWGIGQYASTTLGPREAYKQFLQDGAASLTILGLIYALTAGVMNAGEGLGWIGKRPHTREGPVEAHRS